MGKANLFLAFILALVIGFVGYTTFFLKASPKTMPAHVVQTVKPIRRQVHLGILSVDHVALVRIQETLNRQGIEIERQRMALAHVRAELNRRSAALAADLASSMATQIKTIARQGVILAKQSAALKRHQSEIAKLQKEMDHKVSF